MLDVSGSMEAQSSLLRDAATQLFSRLLPDDLARVGVFGEDVKISPTFTRNADELLAALPTRIRRRAHATLARPGRRARRIRRHRRLAQGDSRAERRQGQRTHRLSSTARESSRRD